MFKRQNVESQREQKKKTGLLTIISLQFVKSLKEMGGLPVTSH